METIITKTVNISIYEISDFEIHIEYNILFNTNRNYDILDGNN